MVPASKTDLYTTAVYGQASVLIRVFQGEAPMVRDNVFLGEFELRGLPRNAPPGEPQIAVTFDYDVNGIVQVRAEERKSRRRGSIEIRDARARMDAADRERASRQVAHLWSQREQGSEIPPATRRLLRRARASAGNAGEEAREALLAIAAEIEDLFSRGPLDAAAEEQLGRLEDEPLDCLQGDRE